MIHLNAPCVLHLISVASDKRCFLLFFQWVLIIDMPLRLLSLDVPRLSSCALRRLSFRCLRARFLGQEAAIFAAPLIAVIASPAAALRPLEFSPIPTCLYESMN